MNAFFPYPLSTTHLPSGRNIVLTSPFVFLDPEHEYLAVPDGFVSDLASIPRIFWVLLPPFGEYLFGAIIHDYLYDSRVFGADLRGWRESDRVLYRAMACAPHPVRLWKRLVIFYGLMLGGWFFYFRVADRIRARLGLRRKERREHFPSSGEDPS